MLTEHTLIGLWVLVGASVYYWAIRDHFRTAKSMRIHLAFAAIGAGLLAPGVVLVKDGVLPMPAMIAAALGVGANWGTETRAILMNVASWAAMTVILSIVSYVVQRRASSAKISTIPF